MNLDGAEVGQAEGGATGEAGARETLVGRGGGACAATTVRILSPNCLAGQKTQTTHYPDIR